VTFASSLQGASSGETNGDVTDDIILGVYEAENEIMTNNGDRSFQKVPLPGGKLDTTSILAEDVNSDWMDRYCSWK